MVLKGMDIMSEKCQLPEIPTTIPYSARIHVLKAPHCLERVSYAERFCRSQTYSPRRSEKCDSGTNNELVSLRCTVFLRCLHVFLRTTNSGSCPFLYNFQDYPVRNANEDRGVLSVTYLWGLSSLRE